MTRIRGRCCCEQQKPGASSGSPTAPISAERPADLPAGHTTDPRPRSDLFCVARRADAARRGLSEATLRRHPQILVQAGLVLRRDNPNGQRSVRRGRGGEGRSSRRSGLTGRPWSPAEENEDLADKARRRHRTAPLARDRISRL
ncbi:helix-turn-helix domain-containing protein [Methylobacterium nodulans]|uniref:helix-turn-helix domain-containing protein n=1 Tax=Methylobacterium nodulans TaxID=114616 RepID=UPI0018DD30C8